MYRRTAYKKALSVLSQAVVLNIALDDYDLSQTDTDSATDGTSASIYNLFNNRMNVAKVCGANDACLDSEQWEPNNDDVDGLTDAEFGDSNNYTFFFNDGIAFTFPADAGECTEGTATDAEAKCYGVIDVNGAKNPNKAVICDGTDTDAHEEDCTVTNPTDIYPVVMYDQSILPNSAAARIVMYGK